MPISWNEIRANALNFSAEWKDASREDADAKSFWEDFFKVFGVTRRGVLASFEEPVKNLKGKYGFIDLFWKGTLLAEHKSRGKDLGKAHSQAMEYIQGLQSEGRHDEVPRYVIVSDFANLVLYDLEEDKSVSIPVNELHKTIELFSFIPGYKTHRTAPDDPLNLKAVQILGDLHDALEAGGYQGHALERMLVRVLFCLFAEDTGIFERCAFDDYLVNHTREDGSDLGSRLAHFFDVLNTPIENRQRNLLEELASLPYVNGDLFSESLGFAAFTREMRVAMLKCTRFDWSRISPAVFGALFQGVMEPKERRQVGAHYTSEKDILKTIGPLFLDDLKATLAKAGSSKGKLTVFIDRLSKIKILDPACGCGNFLVVSYREIRSLELEALQRLHKGNLQPHLYVAALSKIDVDQLYGIEIAEWPARIAEVAIWLVDHQMNQRLSEAFGTYYVRLPLTKSPHILNRNAIRTDWEDVVSARDCSYVVGNPPFVGKKARSASQSEDMIIAFGNEDGKGNLDYVACWYAKAIQYIANTQIRCAFVSTNSISQGEQVSLLWRDLISKGLRINYCHQTFRWKSEAKGTAQVQVVIIGFSLHDSETKSIFQYPDLSGDPVEVTASRINAYLVDAPMVFVEQRTQPISPKIRHAEFGNMPNDDGNLLFTEDEKQTFIAQSEQSLPFFRRFISAKEYFAGTTRWCLWLHGVEPDRYRQIDEIMKRVEAIRRYRLASKRPSTQKLAEVPSLFAEIRQPTEDYVLIPRHSSETRKYVPLSYFKPTDIAGDSCITVSGIGIFGFGVLSSVAHMAWLRAVGGRIKNDYRYSAKLVYNTFPWPEDVSESQIRAVELAASKVLETREKFPDSSLSDLYDPLTMPPIMVEAHAKLDSAVDKCYRMKAFHSERERVEHLFQLYDKIDAGILR